MHCRGTTLSSPHERISDGRRKIKIPNAAIANGVKVVSPFQMLRTEHARFVLSQRVMRFVHLECESSLKGTNVTSSPGRTHLEADTQDSSAF